MRTDYAIALVVLGVLVAVLAVPVCILLQRCRKDRIVPLFVRCRGQQTKADIQSTADALMLSVVTTFEDGREGESTQCTQQSVPEGQQKSALP